MARAADVAESLNRQHWIDRDVTDLALLAGLF
jgi:hypothetical protein